MAERTQSFESHTRWFPPYHFIATPILVVSVYLAARQLARDPSAGTIWSFILTLGILVGIAVSRVQVLAVQNRVIRLEETLRLQRLLPASQQSDIAALSVRDFIALRFASDEEIPELVRRVRAGEFNSPKELKRAIKNWRPDFLRA
ncbi:MAG: DUF6526 family protein [Gemmatimonadaceae bacterium]